MPLQSGGRQRRRVRVGHLQPGAHARAHEPVLPRQAGARRPQRRRRRHGHSGGTA